MLCSDSLEISSQHSTQMPLRSVGSSAWTQYVQYATCTNWCGPPAEGVGGGVNTSGHPCNQSCLALVMCARGVQMGGGGGGRAGMGGK